MRSSALRPRERRTADAVFRLGRSSGVRGSPSSIGHAIAMNTTPMRFSSTSTAPTTPRSESTTTGTEPRYDASRPTADLLEEMNALVRPMLHDPQAIVQWSKEYFGNRVSMSTSMGLQASVLLHLATKAMPDISVVWVDTGYLPKETYTYAEELREMLDLNLIVASNPEWTPARMEALKGKLWESDEVEDHTLYGRMRKVEPLNAGLNSVDPDPLVLLSGIRAAQTKARANMDPVQYQNGRFKLLPMLGMSDEDVVTYMDKFDLPKHPLQAQGYATVGDAHSSRPVEEGEDARDTRFGGKFEECGLHVDDHEPIKPSKTETPEKEPEETVKPGLEALTYTKANPETRMAVIQVKKQMEDDSFCRKCQEVAGKMEVDGVASWIDHTAVAHVLDPNSEGAILARAFEVNTAPFFLVRSFEDELAGKDWRPVRSYLQLRKILLEARDHVLSGGEEEQDSPEKLEAIAKVNALKVEIERLTGELHQVENELVVL